MRTILFVWLLAMGFIFGPSIHDTYVWHQIEKQAVIADLAEGAQK